MTSRFLIHHNGIVARNYMILAILQARVSSTRLPGKVLKPILGVPMLLRQVERIQRSKLIDRLIIATSIDPADDAIDVISILSGCSCYRGSLDDVLDRFYQAAKPQNPDHVIRFTGDCPLSDPQMVDQLITLHLEGKFDYTSNTLEPTYPDGLDAEIFRFLCLEQAWKEAVLPSEREHVTPFIKKHPERFKIGQMRSRINLSHLRWTVDEPIDFMLITRIYEELFPKNPAFTTEDIIAFLDLNPDLKIMNVQHSRDEGYKKSLIKDTLFLKGKI